MGRQWLHAKRAIVNLKKGQTVGKLVKEITVAAKLGGGDPAGNARLFAAVEKAKKASVTRDVIERAIAKGTGTGGDKVHLEHVVFEGYAPHKVPVIVEVYTDNHQRTAPETRGIFRRTRASACAPRSRLDSLRVLWDVNGSTRNARSSTSAKARSSAS